MHGSVPFWWLFYGQSILALCTCNMERKWSHPAMFVQIKRIIDHNCRPHMSIRVLPSRGVVVSPQIAKVPLKSWKMKEMIILMWIKHIVLLPPLSLPFSALRPTFSQVDYEGNEGPDRESNLPPSPCNVLVRLEGTIIEENLTIRLIPRTFEENVAVNGPPPTAERLGSNASSKNMWPQLIYIYT